MKQPLLTDIELDVHELKYLMELFLKEPTPALSELLKRSILRMQERLAHLRREVEAADASPKNLFEDTETSPTLPPVQKAAETAEPSLEVVVLQPLPETGAIAPQPEYIETGLQSEEAAAPVPVSPSRLAAIGDLNRFISLNDSFRFSRELFGGDAALLQRVVEQLSAMTAYDTAVAFLRSKTAVPDDNEALGDFLELLGRYFTPSI